MSAIPDKRLSHLNIEFSEKGVSEFNRKTRVIFIPKEQIRIIQIRFGSSAERPLLQLIGGLLLTGFGVFGIYMFAASGFRGLRWDAGLIVFRGFGIWFLHETFKRNYFLHIVYRENKRKLVFRGQLGKKELSKFVNDVSTMDYVFENLTPELSQKAQN